MVRAWILALGALPLFAAGPDYFPLQVGNRWEYTNAESGQKQIGEVLASEQINGQQWFRVRWLNGADYLLRSVDKQVLEWDRATAKESVWIDFSKYRALKDGTGVTNCLGMGDVLDPVSGVPPPPPSDVPARIALNGLPNVDREICLALSVAYVVYAPGVGLMERTYNGFAGPATMRLKAARIGGKDLTF